MAEESKLTPKEELNNLTDASKKPSKPSGRTAPASNSSSTNDVDATRLQIEATLQRIALLDQLKAASTASGSHKNQKTMADHKFWNTQPVPKHGEFISEEGPIEPNVPVEQVQQEPFPLHKEFEWVEVDMDNETELKELYELLTNNYVEDDDAAFRFDYSAPFLKWALQPPGHLKSWHVGVRVASNKKLVAFIAGIPAAVRSHKHIHHLTEINFLCVHKKLRSKRLAPVLIKEVTRRSHLKDVFQAVYTAGVVLPKPISTCRYYHRSLNPKKLVETNFSRLPHNQTMTRYIRSYRIADTIGTPGWRVMRETDIPQVRELLNQYLSKFELAPVFETDEDVRHWLLPVPNVVWSYVVEDLTHSEKSSKPKITDFISFYSLPSSVIGNDKHKILNAAYLFYLATSVKGGSPEDEKFLKARLMSLVKDALLVAKKLDFDVFNCLDLMDNKLFVSDLKFGKGDGFLNYYLYNWRCKDIEHDKVGLVML